MAKVLGPAQANTQPEIELEDDDTQLEEIQDDEETSDEQEADEQDNNPETDADDAAREDEQEAGAEDEEVASAEDDTSGEEQRVEASRKKSASQIIREQKAEIKRIREEREAEARQRVAEQAREEERRRIADRQTQEQLAAREREMLEAMDPVERVRYENKKTNDAVLAELNRVRREAADARDQAQFQARVSADPDIGAYADEVEATLVKLRANGGDTNREAILAYLVGRDALANKQVKQTKVRADAQRRVKQVSSKAPSGRASSNATRGKGKTPEDRLAGVNI